MNNNVHLSMNIVNVVFRQSCVDTHTNVTDLCRNILANGWVDVRLIGFVAIDSRN
jgi:hypothetical protein